MHDLTGGKSQKERPGPNDVSAVSAAPQAWGTGPWCSSVLHVLTRRNTHSLQGREHKDVFPRR